VISIRALAYMLSLVPDIGLGAATLRQVLFDFGDTAHLTDVQRLALRVIRGSGDYDIPWAKRRRLQEELHNVIRSQAEKRGISEEVMKRKFLSGDETVRPGEVIVSAVREMALRDKTGKELLEAERKIRKLEHEVTELREALGDRQRS
jgi:hypothetical protein